MMLSSFGFNQPFFLTLIIIFLVLLLTLFLVSYDKMEDEDYCENDLVEYPQTVLYNNRAGKRRNQIIRQNSGEQLIIASSSNFDGVTIC
uniref:Uncharacterized protein n=1 Tax=Meloidogyne incognita TaxID=6306 RepID=A0A914L2Z4_MELIC